MKPVRCRDDEVKGFAHAAHHPIFAASSVYERLQRDMIVQKGHRFHVFFAFLEEGFSSSSLLFHAAGMQKERTLRSIASRHISSSFAATCAGTKTYTIDYTLAHRPEW